MVTGTAWQRVWANNEPNAASAVNYVHKEQGFPGGTQRDAAEVQLLMVLNDISAVGFTPRCWFGWENTLSRMANVKMMIHAAGGHTCPLQTNNFAPWNYPGYAAAWTVSWIGFISHIHVAESAEKVLLKGGWPQGQLDRLSVNHT